jgi:hypothetical protein
MVMCKVCRVHAGFVVFRVCRVQSLLCLGIVLFKVCCVHNLSVKGLTVYLSSPHKRIILFYS